jgi:hypothetical protein
LNAEQVFHLCHKYVWYCRKALYRNTVMSCYLNNSLFTTFCNRHCCPPVIVHIFELKYFNFFHFKFSCAINDNFFAIYYSCNNTRFLRATPFSPEFFGTRFLENVFFSNVDEFECFSVYACNYNIFFSSKC